MIVPVRRAASTGRRRQRCPALLVNDEAERGATVLWPRVRGGFARGGRVGTFDESVPPAAERAQQAALRPCLVAELRLKLIPDLRQRLIRTQLCTMKRENLYASANTMTLTQKMSQMYSVC